ncbi:type II secretion system F family protein [Janthinobacterium agaricidamnosum]|uniref:Bacterial type II secretion system F domain protein n=1 Tax=Janthinobacterium agaricidamnosum NBRC 102515 = DSM 9628 TaxID=1349767 RepID=W0V404_9BURK|nr:type II secretion system F family protein [Janthinobacterium agaricidamnosum]CDG82340.1 bacterial type II secretion system F domain protein [Janthinobacterium agaricidamnosum NBRC 102515 = DSM 9628]
MLAELNHHWAKLQFSELPRLRLYRKIAKMLSNGLPLLKILDELWERASSRGRNPNEPMALVLSDCRRMVQNGRSLADGLADWIPVNEQMIIGAGEQSGRLESTLGVLIDVVQAQKKIKNVILSGLSYPLAIGGLILIYLYIFGTRVIPEFARMLDPAGWHGAARSLYVMSQLVQHWMVAIVGLVLAVIAVLLLSMPYWRGNLRVIADRFAPYSIYRLIIGSGFLMAFSALQFAGITVEKSLMRLAQRAQPWLRERLDGALLGVKSGLNCGEALRAAGYGFPSPELVDDLCVYAQYRGFAEALKLMADEWMEEGVATIERQMKLLNGASIVCLATVIGWLVTGFFGIQQEIATMTRAVH